MPYIRSDSRMLYDDIIQTLAERVKIGGGSDKKRAGELNYIITKLLSLSYNDGFNYAVHNEIIGMLECCKQEWYRRKVAPYEDKKIVENGDV